MLQTEIALSTTEADHVVLSHSMREALTLIRLLEETHLALDIEENLKNKNVKCTVFEDNNGCVE